MIENFKNEDSMGLTRKEREEFAKEIMARKSTLIEVFQETKDFIKTEATIAGVSQKQFIFNLIAEYKKNNNLI